MRVFPTMPSIEPRGLEGGGGLCHQLKVRELLVENCERNVSLKGTRIPFWASLEFINSAP